MFSKWCSQKKKSTNSFDSSICHVLSTVKTSLYDAWSQSQMWLNISKGIRCRKTWFWVTRVQSQNILKYGSKVNFKVSHIWNLQYLVFKLLEGFDVKNIVLKMGFSIACTPILCTDSQTEIRALFSKSTFHQSVMPSSMKLPLSWEHSTVYNFNNCCTKIEQPLRK